MRIPSRRKKYKFPFYFFKSVKSYLKLLAFLMVLILILFIVDTAGITFKPEITIDAASSVRTISPYLYGYSIDSEFSYDSRLAQAVKENGAKSLRLVQGYEPGTRMLLKMEDGAINVLAADHVTYNPGQIYEVRAEVMGSQIKIFVEGKKIFEVTDSTFSHGQIGLLSSHNLEVYFDDVEVKNESGNIIFSDNFSGKAKSDWTDKDFPSWHDNGSWQVKNNEFQHLGKQDIAMKMAGDKSWKNYTFKVKMKTPAQASKYDLGFMGISFRQQNVLSSYRFIWRSSQRQPIFNNRPWEVADFKGQLRFLKETGLTPIITVNMREDKNEAADLVRRLNVKEGYNIKYWELGNEIYAWGDGYIDNNKYAEKIKDFASAMKAVDPTIKIGASFLIGFSDWEIDILKSAADKIDFVIFHFYPFWTDSGISDTQLLASPYAFGHNYLTGYGSGMGVVERTYDLIRTYAPHREDKIEFIITEFNTGNYEKGVSLLYGLTVADLLGEMAENGVKIGQFHKLSSEDGYQWGAFTASYIPKPAALAISMFSKHFGTTLVSSEVKNSPTFSVSGKKNLPSMSSVPYLTAYAAKNTTNNKLYLAVINKHTLSSMKTTINITNAKVRPQALVYTLSAPSMYSKNEGANQNVKISTSQITNAGQSFTYNFPAHSFTILEFDITIQTQKQKSKPKEKKMITTPKHIGGPLSTGVYGLKSTIVTAAGPSGGPHVRAFDRYGTPTTVNIMAFDPSFSGGVKIALGDVDGDGKNEIVAGAGLGGGPHLRVFEENGTEIANFFTFHPDFRGGINVAAGDVDGDGQDEIAVSQATAGQAWVKVYRLDANKTIIGQWNAFGSVECGADIAMGDIDADGKDEIIVGAGPGGGPHIRVYEANGELKPISFFAFHPNNRSGISVAAGDVDGDNKAEIGVAQQGTEEAWIKVYRYNDEKTVLGEWKAFGSTRVGANIAMGDIDHDGKAEIVAGAGFGGGPQVLGFESNGYSLPTNFFAYDENFRGGVEVAVTR